MHELQAAESALPAVKSVTETERKLSVEADFRLPELSGQPLPRRLFTSTYFDTLDHCLSRSGITLRRRVENGSGLWQLKLPLNGARREIELQDDSKTPPSRFVDALIILLEGKHLVPIAHLHTSRKAIRLDHGRSHGAEVMVDTVSVLQGRSIIQQFREVEIESLNGKAEVVDRLASALYKVGARHHDGRPKLFRALSLAYHVPDAPSDEASFEEHVRYRLLEQLQILKRCDPVVRLTGEAEAVHQIRVAARRMRTVLLAVRKIAPPDWVEPLIAGLKWLSELFAHARDLDVQMRYFRRAGEELKAHDRRPLERFLRHLQTEREKTQRTLMDEIKSAQYLGVVSKLLQTADVPVVVKSDRNLMGVAARQFRKLRKTVKKLKHSPSDRALHRVRIKTKRARYAAELCRASGGKPVARFLKTAEQFQDLLGANQDAVLAERFVRGFLKHQTGKQAAFTAGLLVARAKRQRQIVRDHFQSEWKRLKKRGNRAWC
jgi:CHAD domain-containing protein